MTLPKDGGITLRQLLDGWVAVDAKPAHIVRGLCHDSRKLREGDLFFALSGCRSHGMAHAKEAAKAGACAILFDPAGGGAEMAAREDVTSIPCIPVENLDQLLGRVADRYFDEPSRDMDVIGITGTNGKTSCSHFLADALADEGKSAVIGTLGWGKPGDLQPTIHTTPDAIEVHGLLGKLRNENYRYVAMEASSHGLEQGRLNGVRFKGGLFTNLSRDHLDYHKTMEAYLAAKLRLVHWPGLEFLVFNGDDPSSDVLLAQAPSNIRKIAFTTKPDSFKEMQGLELLQASSPHCDNQGLSFAVSFEGKTVTVSASVYGSFNVQNLLGSLGVLLGLGYPLEKSVKLLGKVKPVPGRMEQFSASNGAQIVVDYSHTPDALEKALESLKEHCRGDLWVVFGCGGDRDKGKRPQMGAVAHSQANRIVLTDDNPRTENGDAIILDILEGFAGQSVPVLRDRRAAIAFAVDHLQTDDILLVAGKGHEDYQEINGVRHPFSDQAVIKELLGQSKVES